MIQSHGLQQTDAPCAESQWQREEYSTAEWQLVGLLSLTTGLFKKWNTCARFSRKRGCGRMRRPGDMRKHLFILMLTVLWGFCAVNNVEQKNILTSRNRSVWLRLNGVSTQVVVCLLPQPSEKHLVRFGAPCCYRLAILQWLVYLHSSSSLQRALRSTFFASIPSSLWPLVLRLSPPSPYLPTFQVFVYIYFFIARCVTTPTHSCYSVRTHSTH